MSLGGPHHPHHRYRPWCQGLGAALTAALAVAALLLAPVSGLAQSPRVEPDLGLAEQLVRQGKAEEAWKLLSPHEFDLAGREDFDYLLGVAALESGRADLATLVFERVLAVNPSHAAARLDMGRAYFTLGDLERARTEFNSVLRFDPPPAARATVERYLGVIEERTTRGRVKVTAYVEGTMGTDGNINGATSQSALFIPLFGANFNLASTSVRSRDEYLSLGGGLEISAPVGDSGFGVFAGGDLRQRSHFRLDWFDSNASDLRLGVSYTRERHMLRISTARNDYDLDGNSYRKTTGQQADYRYVLDPRTQLAAFMQGSAIRYVQAAARSNGSNLFLYGAGIARTLDESSRSVVVGSAFRGDDVATDGRSDGDRRLWGLRVGYQRGLAPRADWFMSAALQKSTYSLTNVLFSTVRKDWQYDLSGGVNWQFQRDWALRPQVSYTRNDSTLGLNDYDRYEFAVTLRRDWK